MTLHRDKRNEGAFRNNLIINEMSGKGMPFPYKIQVFEAAKVFTVIPYPSHHGGLSVF